MRYLLTFLLALCLSISISAQDYFQVEFEKFSPPEKALIKELKGFPAPPFLASDVDGEEHFLGDYKGKTVLIWFWSLEDELSFSMLPYLNILQLDMLDDLKIFGFAKEAKDLITPHLKEQAAIFSNFPNSSVFGEAVYAGDLGQGRMILVDEFGIVKEVLPRRLFEEKTGQEIYEVVLKAVAKLK